MHVYIHLCVTVCADLCGSEMNMNHQQFPPFLQSSLKTPLEQLNKSIRNLEELDYIHHHLQIIDVELEHIAEVSTVLYTHSVICVHVCMCMYEYSHMFYRFRIPLKS